VSKKNQFEFIDAKTISEAEERIRSIGIKKVSLKGLKIADANGVLKAIEQEDRIRGLSGLNSLYTYRKSSDRVRAGYSRSHKLLKINLSHVGKNIKRESIISYEQQIKIRRASINKWTSLYLGNNKYSLSSVKKDIRIWTRDINNLERQIKNGETAKPWSISSTLEKSHDNLHATIVHEIGHFRHDENFNNRESFSVDKINAVTEYSKENYKEYFAENYANYRINGAENTPSDLLKLFKEIDNAM